MIESIKKLSEILNKRQIENLIFLGFLLFFGMIIEIFSIGVILPIFSFIGGDENFIILKTLNNLDFIKNIEQKQLLIFSAVLILSVYLFKALYMIYLAYKQNQFLSNLSLKLSSRLFAKYILMPYKNHVEGNTSNLIKNILVEVNTFNSFCQSLLTLITECFLSFTIILTLFIIEPIGALIIAFFFSFSGFIFFYYTRKQIKFWGQQRQIVDNKLSKIVLETFGSIKELKLHKSETFFMSKFYNLINQKAQINIKNDTIGVVPKFFLEIIAVFGMIGFILYGILNENEINQLISTLGVFAVGSFKVIPSINKIIFCLQKMKFCSSSIDLVNEELKEYSESLKSEKKLIFSKEIIINDLYFSYENNTIISGSSMLIKKGQTIGIIGESGSGKSTLINLLSGLLDNYTGSILIDGKNLKELTDSWQRSIGFVPQDVYLLDDTILNNIAFGIDEENINLEKVNKILKTTQLFDFINSLESGLMTRTGEKGIQLSGGQKQRIGIARALYSEPEVIFLDEPTSALDNKTEKALIYSLSKLREDITFIIISHNSDSLNDCDCIFEISNKKIEKIR